MLADNIRMLDLLARFTDVLEVRMKDGVKAIVFAPRGAPPAGTP